MNPRDLADYTDQYQSAPFEPIQIKYRRKLVLEQISKHAPIHLVEVGCGLNPLFTSIPRETICTVVEPTPAFAENARSLASDYPNANVVEDFVENIGRLQRPCDMIVVSCLLHEVRDAASLLEGVKRLCGRTTVAHFNVPNALSFHRLLAAAMGVIPEPGAPSETQRKFQQRGTTYSMATLEDELDASGFSVFDKGTLFVKPFTHNQMQSLVDSDFMSGQILDGLNNLTKWLPDLGSEIWANARLKSPPSPASF